MKNEAMHETLLSCQEAAEYLGSGITPENIHARVRRGSLTAVSPDGTVTISKTELDRVLREVDACAECNLPATTYLIVKYQHHERVEFSLCKVHALAAQMVYRRKGGVLEVVAYPLLGEGWQK